MSLGRGTHTAHGDRRGWSGPARLHGRRRTHRQGSCYPRRHTCNNNTRARARARVRANPGHPRAQPIRARSGTMNVRVTRQMSLRARRTSRPHRKPSSRRGTLCPSWLARLPCHNWSPRAALGRRHSSPSTSRRRLLTRARAAAQRRAGCSPKGGARETRSLGQGASFGAHVCVLLASRRGGRY